MKTSKKTIFKVVLKITTLGTAIAALVISLQNKSEIRWLEGVQDNIIEKVLFHE